MNASFTAYIPTGSTSRMPTSFLPTCSTSCPGPWPRTSAEVRGHGPGQEVLQAGKKDVGIREIEPVGSYAVKLAFTDGHDTGIYSWEYLHELGAKREANWKTYLARLAQAGKGREP